MNVNQLHRALGELIAKGHGRKPVAINASTFDTRHLDDANILPVKEATGPTFVCKSDDDGGTKWNKDGSEAGTFTVILRGDYSEQP